MMTMNVNNIVSGVESFEATFAFAEAFSQDLSKWNISSATTTKKSKDLPQRKLKGRKATDIFSIHTFMSLFCFGDFGIRK